MATDNDKMVLNQILNPFLPSEGASGDKAIAEDAPIDHPHIEESRAEEVLGVRAADAGQLEEAIRRFTESIRICDINASAYNNRAQAYRLADQKSEAFNDLETAIKLSEGEGRTGCQAFIQRALLYRLEGKDEEALEDFKKASALGSSFAKLQVVALNPYAAMCNKMLAQVFTDLKQGKSTPSE